MLTKRSNDVASKLANDVVSLRTQTQKERHDFHRVFLFAGATRNRTGDKGFADLCLTAWLWRRFLEKAGTNRLIRTRVLERITGLEPATSTLARWRSTK